MNAAMRNFQWFLLVMYLCSVPLALAEELRQGVTTKPASLMAESRTGSDVVIELDEGSPVVVIVRKGGWYQVKTVDGKTGWLKMLALRFEKAEGASGSDIKALVNLQSSSSSTQVSGVRGVGKESLTPIAPADSAVDQLPQFKPSEQEVKQFAEEGELKSQVVDAEDAQ